ncbi:MAG TPA: glycoside hydrolase family 3 N-terminal domain-containing protein [Polyangiaceae bacterium]|nr:glycoside hydrolase family 3 N-terminal domain-containing protein [Polyangiaceae bacterium]
MGHVLSGWPRRLGPAVLGLAQLACGTSIAGPSAVGSMSGADGGIDGAPLDGTTAGIAVDSAVAAASSPRDAPSSNDQVTDDRATALLGEMTLAEKIGQMVMVDYGGLASLGDIATYGIGAILPSADEAPSTNAPQTWSDLTASFRAQAASSRLKIPLLLGIDAVHGNAKVAGATVFPHDIGLGATRDAALVTQVERATAAEVIATGFNMAFSPDSDVGQDERWGRTYESFGEDPTLASLLVTAAVGGYQGPGLGAAGAILACPKHFLGAGGTTWGTGVSGGIDEGDTQITDAEMRAVHLPPFKAAVDAGAMVIMVSYSSFNGDKMSSNGAWVTGVLKGELGFSGIVLSDFNAIRKLSGTSREQAAAAIGAGLDMIMMSDGYTGFIDDVTALVSDGTIPASRIDDAVTRILRAKFAAGLFDASRAAGAANATALGGAAARRLARQAVQESLVLLKNDGALLPLSKSAHVVVAGPGANDLGVQSGGWTLGWNGVTQGSSAAIGGTTILAGMQAAATSPDLVTYSWDGSTVPSGTTVGVVVLYENPYAEFEGDTNDPSFDNTSSSQNPSGHVIYDGLAAGIVGRMTAAKVPLVLLLVTGRPVRIESYLPRVGAVVAAWLPGSEGEGVADVLYGSAKFSGVLPKSWPRDATALPISSLQSNADPLFAYGFGLTYP